jgi:23S rRNA (uracil1939-C5)-methyltransferase
MAKGRNSELVKKDGIYEIEMTGMNHDGQGVGRVDNFTVFVNGAIIGEKVRVKIVNLKKTYAVGELHAILQPSPDRVDILCPVGERCGGCSLQHMSYKAQLDFKTNMVKESIKRIGKLEDVLIHHTIGMENALNYRNKAQYPVGAGPEGKALLGFYERYSHKIVDCTSCMIQDETSTLIKNIVRAFIHENNISLYDESTGKGLIRHLMTRTGFKTGEIMVVLVLNGKDLPHKQKLVDNLTTRVPGIKSIVLNVNEKNTNIILGSMNIKIYGEGHITDYIGKYRFSISPLSFFQVNPAQTEVLYNKAIEYAALSGKETVFDLYCGIGTISLFLSEKAKKVYGIEVVEEAIKDAKVNAEINGVKNIEFITGEAEKVVPEVYKQGIKADVVVVDPPRKGCDEALLKTLVSMQPERIVYVSCKPSTLARDLAYLSERGYKAVEIQPVDMFPYTVHVECVVLITR